jgi:hypothetical protein
MGTRLACALTRPARLAAAFTAVTAWTVATSGAGVTAPPPPYASLIVGLAVLVGFVAAAEVRRTNRFEARLAAVVVTVLTVAGQLLVTTVGFPASSPGQWTPGAAIVVVLGSGVPVLVALDARLRAGSTTQEHPYAR